MTETEYEDFKCTMVNLVPETDNVADLSALNGPADITIALVGTAPTTITASDTNDIGDGTVKAWTFPAAVNGVACLNIAGCTAKYLFFTSGASANSTLGTIFIFTRDRESPANSATVANLTP